VASPLPEKLSGEGRGTMFIQFVKLKSGLPETEVQRIMKERAAQFRAVPGLRQKYYCRDDKTGEYAGVYVWESEESMQAFL
jgi:heme-degrading monooxygenase HmoA